MRRFCISLIILVVLSVVALYLFFSRDTGTLKRSDRDFAIKDTSIVYQVEFAEGDRKLSLKKEGQVWRVNGNFPVQKRLMRALLIMLSGIDVSAPVPNSLYHEIYTNLREHSKRIMILQEDMPPKVYYVFYDTISNATYMLLEYSTKPFRIQIPGYATKNLHALYRMNESYWRDNAIFRLMPYEITYVSVIHPENPGLSFEIEKMQEQLYQVRRLSDSEVMNHVNMENLSSYLSSFSSVNFEKILGDLENSFVDSLLCLKSYKQITVKDIYANETVMKIFPRYHQTSLDSVEFDYNYLYAEINENGEILLIKYVDIDPIFKDLSYFTAD